MVSGRIQGIIPQNGHISGHILTLCAVCMPGVPRKSRTGPIGFELNTTKYILQVCTTLHSTTCGVSRIAFVYTGVCYVF
jgi:hypothetical protein